ncbi:MAG: CDP-glucose 4,6-dehydratase [Synergistaceae bacterium]|jgi:CDP-glucose 4,6-dehydratase|nr:CDP-glucose 4,6-dehydratase [Synergistaceae bacterium]
MVEKLPNFWSGRRVFLTGHTGFKGCWFLIWLKMLGADVFGYSLPPLDPSLYKSAFGDREMNGIFADVRDKDGLKREMTAQAPEMVFHFAAQPLVRESYKQPVLTYETNVMGTVNLLEAVRGARSVKSVVVITTDKCYRDMDWEWAYRETDELGGVDPYSSSKACVELLCDAWRQSFFKDSGTLLATARAGNVIGGGDWSEDRLVPDAMRAFQRGETLEIRSPNAVRPWQHVLEPLYGYMLLAERLYAGDDSRADAWNFGPSAESAKSVEGVVQAIREALPGDAKYKITGGDNLHETLLLRLDASKAIQKLGWRPKLDFKEALSMTVEWYRRAWDGCGALSLTREQISKYMEMCIANE